MQPYELPQLVVIKECLELLFQFLERFEWAQPFSDPFNELWLDRRLLVPAVDQEDAGEVVLVTDASSDYLVHFSDRRHFVPVVACDALVLRLQLLL